MGDHGTRPLSLSNQKPYGGGGGGGGAVQSSLQSQSGPAAAAAVVVEKRGVKVKLLRRLLEISEARPVPFTNKKLILNKDTGSYDTVTCDWTDEFGWTIGAVANILIGNWEMEQSWCRWSSSSDGQSRYDVGEMLTGRQEDRCSLIDVFEKHHKSESGSGSKSKSNDEPHPDLRFTYDDVVGDANWFVSFAYMGSFSNMVDAIDNFMKKKGLDEESTYLWIDPIVNNNWVADKKQGRDWCETFKGAINDIGNTVLVLSPWVDPYYLKRLW